jgi:hypothetical protein
MKGKSKPKREQKKTPGIFAEKKRKNRDRRKRVIALLLGSDKCSEEDKFPVPSEGKPTTTEN